MKLKLRLLFKLVLVIGSIAGSFVLTVMIYPVLGFIFNANKARIYQGRSKQAWFKGFSRALNLHVTIDGALPKHAVLMVGNHISWLDIVAIGQLLPGYFVAKNDILNWPVIGLIAQKAGTIFIRRGDKSHIMAIAEKIVWLLKQQSNIFIFPEGTTTVGDDVLNFHASLFQPALLTKIPVQPIAIQYSEGAKNVAPFVGDDAFVPHLLRMLALDKIDVTITLLPLVATAGKTRQAVSAEARELIRQHIVAPHQISHAIKHSA